MRGVPIGLGRAHILLVLDAPIRSRRAGSSVRIAVVLLRRDVRRGEHRHMRRTGHIRERSPGSFEIRYSLGTDPATGRRKMATATVRGSRKDADKELRRLLRTLDMNEHIDPTRMTLKQWQIGRASCRERV